MNIHRGTVDGFGEEWSAFDQIDLDESEHRRMFDQYFRLFPLAELEDSEGFDLGCGSGRWAYLVASRVRKLHCIDPAPKAVEVARKRLSQLANVEFHVAAADGMPLADETQDFGYSLGVLHHVPDTAKAMASAVAKLKPGAPFLVYIYYRFDNRPNWYRELWRLSEVGRSTISRLPFRLRRALTDVIAASVYWPFARSARLAERLGARVANWPLAAYRDSSFYTMRTDALDRFGTRLEQRFSRDEIATMLKQSGLTDIRFSDEPPYWVAMGRKADLT